MLFAGCGGTNGPASPSPGPAPDAPIANAYILPGAANLGANAFGDHPIVVFKGEQLRWRNIDAVEHTLVPDTRALPEFTNTGALQPGGDRSFLMNTLGTTTFHCTTHPQMVGTLIVQAR